MRPRPLSDAGVGESVPAAAIGRASRAAAKDADVFRLPKSDEARGDELLALGIAGIGGFTDGGIDDEGPWLVRRLPRKSLSESVREAKGHWPFAKVLPIALGIARALAHGEARRTFIGPLAPDGIRIDGDRVVLVAASLVTEILGGASAKEKGGSPSWTPPEQADGAPWDDAANRYVLGLVLYRLLAGEHAFGGGLRAALDGTNREAAPFSEAVAETLPPGCQALTLRLLAPSAADRPARASDVLDALANLARGTAEPHIDAPRGASAILSHLSQGGAVADARDPRAARKSVRAAAGPPMIGGFRLSRLVPLAVGALAAACSLALLAPAPAKPATPTVSPREPLTAAHARAEECATCHARQAAEWRRSVMAHAVRSPLFNGLESLIEEQVGRDTNCPNGAGILRKVDVTRACRDGKSGLVVTGSGGEHWCVNCHTPLEKLEGPLAAWDGRAGGDPASRRPVRDLLGARSLEGISCGFCHEVGGPVGARVSAGGATSAASYTGNANWTSFATGQVFASRPEDARGLFGIANSGYRLDPEQLFGRGRDGSREAGGVHGLPSAASKQYLASSEFCGSCHDVRLFGTDTVGATRGEHFKRLRNAYSEWAAWAKDQNRLGKPAASCQDCHLSTYPGVCEPDPNGEASDPSCPAGTRFVAHAPGSFPKGAAADNSTDLRDVVTHYFSGVDVPLSPEFPEALVDEGTVDAHGVPLSARRRRDLLLRHTFRFGLGRSRASSGSLSVPIEVENVGAGHRVPAGFSQEREIWVHLVVKDGRGSTVYEVGRVDRGDEDLRDKIFERVNTNPSALDGQGRPEGLFGADLRDGPDVPAWSPPPGLGATNFHGKGLVNFQNGFFRCVRCIGIVAADGHCEAGIGQGERRADRFADGDYDIDTGACRSNLEGQNALFETYFPVGALDASRGAVKGPDAILDTRSVPPGVPLTYTYELATSGRPGPFNVTASLLFRAFPPFLVRGFAAYEREQARRGLRPSGPLVTDAMLKRLEVVEIGRATQVVAP